MPHQNTPRRCLLQIQFFRIGSPLTHESVGDRIAKPHGGQLFHYSRKGPPQLCCVRSTPTGTAHTFWLSAAYCLGDRLGSDP